MDLLSIRDAAFAFVDLGGPVVAVLLGLSVISLAVILFKFWTFVRVGVGRRRGLESALRYWDSGDRDLAISLARHSQSHMRHVLIEAMEGGAPTERLSERLAARADAQLSTLESGFRLLDSIAQIAPLLGLFGTVLGMIDAFQQLQGAGASVDPSILAGGIWVALMTTAVGLAVAMPTSLILTWLESRVAGDRIFADKALQMILCPNAQGQPRAA